MSDNTINPGHWIVDVGIPIAGEDWRTAFDFGDRLAVDVRKWNGEVESSGTGLGTRDIQFVFDSEAEAAQAYDWVKNEMKQAGYNPDEGTDEELIVAEMTCYISMYDEEAIDADREE